jgi:aryl-alcohol dehydrogenase-like predicted oxidoreductase
MRDDFSADVQPNLGPTHQTTPATSLRRSLGRGGTVVSALGVGCWAIGGPWTMGSAQAGWGEVDDDESVAALRTAMGAGVTFFDTAANYGAGHSERVLGRAVAGRRDDLVLATKFGYVVDEDRARVEGVDLSPTGIRGSCEASLRRLGTTWIDLFQLHVGDLDPLLADDVIAVLDGLVDDGLIRAYGWSTDDPARAVRFATGRHCAAVQHQLNVLEDNPAMLDLCRSHGLASINRGPLAMGLLTGAYDHGASFPADDLRSQNPAWLTYFVDGRPNPQWLARLAAIREILGSGGRTLAQGAIAWIWGRSPVTVPIPGVRTVAQARANAAALQQGPLTPAQIAEIRQLLAALDD